jgi:hypothetical protein
MKNKIIRFLIRWCAFKPLYRIECLIDSGKLKKDWRTPTKVKWLGNLNYKLAKLSMFYGQK